MKILLSGVALCLSLFSHAQLSYQAEISGGFNYLHPVNNYDYPHTGIVYNYKLKVSVGKEIWKDIQTHFGFYYGTVGFSQIWDIYDESSPDVKVGTTEVNTYLTTMGIDVRNIHDISGLEGFHFGYGFSFGMGNQTSAHSDVYGDMGSSVNSDLFKLTELGVLFGYHFHVAKNTSLYAQLEYRQGILHITKESQMNGTTGNTLITLGVNFGK